MHQRKSKKLLVYFFLLIILSSISNYSINFQKIYKIQNINVSGLSEKDNQKLLNEIKNLSLENIFFIDKSEIKKFINENSLIEKYEVLKKYPSSINIKIEKTNFYAKINYKGTTYLIGSNGKLTLSKSGYNELPYIFGKPDINEFLKIKKIIDESKFSYKQIKDLYFFSSNRWDIKLKNGILIKLPNNFTLQNLNYLFEFLKNYNGENFNIVDARIKNQIILNE